MYRVSNDVQPMKNPARSIRLGSLYRSIWLLVLAMTTTVTLSMSEGSAQDIPQYWPYQGFLIDTSGSPIDGNVSLTINIYSDALANTPVWTGSLNAVAVNNGAFSVDLGEVGGEELTEVINSGAAKYIGVAVNDGVELTPRTRIGAVPYATISSNALALGGQPPSTFVTQEGLQAAIPNLDDLNAAIQEIRTIAEGAQTTATTNTETITAVGAVAEAGLTEDEARTLIGTFGYLTQEAIIALIDARGYLSANAITALINELITNRGYLTADAITARINELIDNRGYLTAEAITTLVNGLIDDRDYTTEVEVRELATTITTNAVTAAETRLNARIDGLITRMNAFDAEQDQQDLDRQQLSNQISALQTAVAQAGQSATAAQTSADNAQDAADNAQTAADNAQTAADTAQIAADNAQTTADNAQTTADNAQTAADNAQTSANAAAQDAATALQTAQDALAAAGASGAPFILGPSATASAGKFEFRGHQGVRAAGEMCKVSYSDQATAHYCSPGEVQAALSVGNYEGSINGVETWMFPIWIQHNNGNVFEGDNDFCQSLLYNSGHVAQGTSMTILLDAGSTSGGTGVRMAFNNNRACGTALRVLCCR